VISVTVMVNLIQQANFGASGLGLWCRHTLQCLGWSSAAMLADFMPMTSPALIALAIKLHGYDSG